MKAINSFNVVFVIGVSIFYGCDSACEESSQTTPKNDIHDVKPISVMRARYSPEPVKIDGILDDSVWAKTIVYDMHLPTDRAVNNKLQETGRVQLAWNNEYLFIGIQFNDSDLVAEGKEDQLHHYLSGDVCELFLKPADKTWYWELYVTPNGMKTTFFYPSQGRFGLKSCFEDYVSGLEVGADCKGSLNNWADSDRHWTAEMAIPVEDLTARGEHFGPETEWRILVARYNYSYALKGKGPEVSSSPRLSVTDWHFLAKYAFLKLE